ncbi:hypothetical protein COF64_22735 [Bacillus sp. AFS043905]|nr:hypothetical protein COF64_22735 [Bacillus sp. AFS043905]
MSIHYYENFVVCCPILCRNRSVGGWRYVPVKKCGGFPALVAVCGSCEGVIDDSKFFSSINNRRDCSESENKLKEDLKRCTWLWSIPYIPKSLLVFVFSKIVIPKLLKHCCDELEIKDQVRILLKFQVEKEILVKFPDGTEGEANGTYSKESKTISLSEHIFYDLEQCLKTFFHEMAHARQHLDVQEYNDNISLSKKHPSQVIPHDFTVSLWATEFDFAVKKDYDQYFFKNLEYSAREYAENKIRRLNNK